MIKQNRSPEILKKSHAHPSLKDYKRGKDKQDLKKELEKVQRNQDKK